MFLLFLKTWWKEILFALVIAADVWYVQNLRVTVAQQETKIVLLEADNKTLKDNNATLVASIGAVNGSLEKLGKGVDKTNQSFAALGKTVDTQSKNLDSRLALILKDKKPLTCQDAIKYLLDATKEYK
jgi:peptidoglycan hydrolase CwlO-like protein